MKALKEITVGETAFGCVLNGFFTALALVDLSVDHWVLSDFDSRKPMLETYYAWRHDAPYISIFMGILLLLLPIAVWNLIAEDVIGLWTRPAFRKRHVIGTINLVALIIIITLVITQVKPLEDEFANKTAGNGLLVAQTLRGWHVVMLLLNFGMLAIPTSKYNAAKTVTDAITGSFPPADEKKTL